jgi:hypothetical protein
LTADFATAQIRIIPKKGDTSKLKNWRPISLLSNFYKILSRAINNRLKGVVNRVLSRAQKGFTKSRQIQEVIINIDETIFRCKEKNINGAMICVDQAKAFDSVDHAYMEKAFKFFNFGEKFIGWLKTIGTNRRACVLLGNGKVSNFFDLLKGTAQGDCPSPIVYNICAQILIFKIELDKNIRKLPIFDNLDPPEQSDEIFSYESNLETTKNESFADDSTTLTYFEYEDLAALKKNLEDFEKLSGLKCNFDKTVIMRIGNTDSLPDPRIAELGFAISNECKLLGFTISQSEDRYKKNFEQMDTKVRNVVNFWKIFNLSLYGKITIVKSLIYPILNYYLAILPATNEWLNETEKLIENFVLQHMNVSKEKCYLDPKFGGLGLFNPGIFFRALKCSWVKRCLLLKHDNWRRLLYAESGSAGLCYVQETDAAKFGPILRNILESFIFFRDCYGSVYNNFLMIPILNNKKFFFKLDGEQQVLDKVFMNNNFNALDDNRMRTLCWADLRDGTGTGNLKSINQLRLLLGDNTSAEAYRNLTFAHKKAIINYESKNSLCMPIHEFLNKKFKGSRKFRDLMMEAERKKRPNVR